MSNNKGSGGRLEAFFAGKGFYIVLFLCVAVIGVSAYMLLTNSGTDVDNDIQTGSASSSQSIPGIDSELQQPEEPVMAEQLPQETPAAVTEPPQTAPAAEVQQEPQVPVAQYIWPLEGTIELPYSVTALVYNKKLGDWRTSDGVEIAAALGTQVMASGSGRVQSVTRTDMGGTTVVIEHAGGLVSVYSNLAELPTVYEGDDVMTGEVIGSVGATAPGETPENPHLCFKMKLDGQSVDPSEYLPPR